MIDRRTFCKASLLGTGALAFGPGMSSFAVGSRPAGTPKRFVFIRKSNGQRPHEFTLPTLPDNLLAKDKNKEAFEVPIGNHELPDCMHLLDGDREHLTILHGLSCKMSENGHTSHQSVMGCFKSGGGNISRLKRATIDFELAKLFPSPVGHVELSFAGSRQGIVSGFSVPTPYRQNYCYADPITAYNNLFKSVLDPAAVHSDNKMLEHLKETEGKKSAGATGDEKNSYRNHIGSIEETLVKNKKLLKMSEQIAKHMPDFEKIKKLGDSAATTPQKEEAMTEVLVAALVSGITNVVTYTIDDLATSITGLPGYEKETINIHSLGHGESEFKTNCRREMRTSHIRQAKTIMDRLKQQPEGDGTMFDNTMILYFPEGGETHHGVGTEAPFVILSGKNCNLDIAGRYIRLPYWATQGHKTLGNWYTTLLNAHGNPIKHYGDLDTTMTLRRMPQEGAIEHFIKRA